MKERSLTTLLRRAAVLTPALAVTGCADVLGIPSAEALASNDAGLRPGATEASVDGAGSGDFGADAASAVDAAPPPPLPAIAGATHLRLWLSADRGITCTGGRVGVWLDGSGHADDAAPRLAELGPQCRIPSSPHQLAGVDVPYFSAPTGNNILDESLDVDLGFLAGSEYTILVVERRWADRSPAQGSFFIGTTAPDQSALACGHTTDQNAALQFGYVYYNSELRLVLDYTCTGLGALEPAVPSPPPIHATYDVARLGADRGRELWVDGTLAASLPTVTTPLFAAAGGAIGRAFVTDPATGLDARFVGDIAEVLVYDAALDDADLQSLDAYLRQHWGL